MMKIALTKKLADALKLKLPPTDETLNPLFTWTANWTNVWSNRRTEDLLVLVNNATLFTVAIYQVKRKNLKNVPEMMKNAIEHTLLSMNLNPELVREYMLLAGDLEFVKNSNRTAASHVSKAGLECAIRIGHQYHGTEKMFSDTVGATTNYRLVNYSKNFNEAFEPHKAMADALTKLTGMKAFKSRAFELLVTLDLEVYQAERRIIVPAGIKFTHFHRVLQEVFDWEDYHLFDFTLMNEATQETVVRIVPYEENLEFDERAVLMEEHTLDEIFPNHKQMIYTYDYGDNWEHHIQLVRVIEEYDGELPYLLEAKGRTPPEDIGGVGGFINFREIMLNPKHPEHAEMKEWVRFWSPELWDWERKPQAIHLRII